MPDPDYLGRMSMPPEAFKSERIAQVGAYLHHAGDPDGLLETLNQAENDFLLRGNLEAAITGFRKIYHAIPEGDAVAKLYADLVLLEAKGCRPES